MTSHSDDLVSRLRALARAEHSDLSVGDEAADMIEQWEVLSLVELSRTNTRLRAALERIAHGGVTDCMIAQDIAANAIDGSPKQSETGCQHEFVIDSERRPGEVFCLKCNAQETR